MGWITNLLQLLGMLFGPTVGFIIFLMRRKEKRAIIQAEINQQHRKGILLVLWYNPTQFDAQCEQSLLILSNATNMAEGFDKFVWEDTKGTAKMIEELRQNTGFLSNGHLLPNDQKRYSTRNAEFTTALMTKLNRI